MSLFGGGIIGQTLALGRSNTIAPQAPSHHVNGAQAQTFESAVNSGQNSIGLVFKPCQPPNPSVSTQTVNKDISYFPQLCCITGIDQFQNACIFELALNDRMAARSGSTRPPSANYLNLLPSMGNAQGGFSIGNNAQNPAPSSGLFGQQAPATSGGLFGQQAPAPAATGGLFGQAPAPAATGGLFGQAPAPAATGGLFGQTPAPATSGGLFGQTPAPSTSGGLFGQAPAASGGLFGQSQPTSSTGGLFGTTPILQAAPNASAKKGGLFGTSAPSTSQTSGGLFSMTTGNTSNSFSLQQQQQQPNYWNTQNTNQNSVNGMIEEMQRIEEAQAAQKKQEENQKNSSTTFGKNSINHINYLKSKQQKRSIEQIYLNPNLQKEKFIEAPYNVKVNLPSEQLKRNEWQLLQRSQDLKSYPNPRYNYPTLQNPQISHSVYSQLSQLERERFQESTQSLAQKDEYYKQIHANSFEESNLFKRLQPVVEGNSSQQFNKPEQQEQQYSIAYLYEQSLKNSAKTFMTNVSLQVNSHRLTIPVQIKSANSISYLLTKVFDYIEETYNISPEKLPIFQRNYVLYYPKEIDHILQIDNKESLISDIERSDSGELGNFEVIELTESEMEDIIGEGGADGEIIYEEDGDYQGNHQQDDLQRLPIIPQGYSIEPNLMELKTKTQEQLAKFKNFKIRNQFAEICFEAEIDLNYRDFSKELLIKEAEIIVYPYRKLNEAIVQPGYGINVQATIKRFNVSRLFLQQEHERFDIQKIERKINKFLADNRQVELVEPYNEKSDSFTVRVLHF